jgi:hypothetical protein
MRRLFCITVAAVLLAPSAAESARVKGSVRRAHVEVSNETIGYTLTPVAGKSKSVEAQESDVVIFLRANKSGVLPKPTEHLKMSIRGLRLEPEVSGCEVDGQVTLVNEESTPLSVLIGDDNLGVLKPNEERTYACTGIKGNAESEMRDVRVKEWPHMRGAILIGDLGVVAAPDAKGSFELNAVEGTYVLSVFGMNGPVAKKDVEVSKSDVDVGALDLRPEAERAEAAPPPPAAAVAKPKRPKPPPSEDEDLPDDEEAP